MYHYDNERAITITADVIKELTTPLDATANLLDGIDIDTDWPGMAVSLLVVRRKSRRTPWAA